MANSDWGRTQVPTSGVTTDAVPSVEPTTVRTFGQQKAALTRAERSHQNDRAARHAAVQAECRRTIAEWDSQAWADAHKVRRGAWPDDWARWQRALDDSAPGVIGPRLEDL